MLATLFIILFLLEFYVFMGLRANFQGKVQIYVLIIDGLMFLTTLLAFISMFIFYNKGLSITIGWINVLMGLSVAFTVTKFVYIIPLLFEDIYRLGDYIVQLFRADKNQLFASRRAFISNTGLALASIPLSTFLHGVFIGRYNFRVFREKLAFKDLPEAFDGFKIAQISDVHSGSFDSIEAMKKGLDLLMEQKPDIILFTGDLVNNLSEEFNPYIDVFKSISAPFGKFSVLGNHDYGLYIPWQNEEDKKANLERVKAHHPAMGFDLLTNENRILKKNGETIRLAGVENWGRPPFPPLGDIDKALKGVNENEFTILMSHDPHHWDDIVLKHPKHIHLTLSGHTHGMQMGIDLPGFKWSPVSLRYKRWAGLYKELNQYIYVNRGFGHLGFPGRVGIMPEITIIELKKEQ